MISAMLDGGLGGRMFQIAAAYVLALDNGDECAFNFSMGSMSQDHPLLTYRNNVYRKLKDLSEEWVPECYYRERRYNFDPIPYRRNLMISGFFSSERYFNHRRKEIIELFKDYNVIDFLALTFRSKFTNSVSLHVRRGDYLVNASHVCSEDYYKKALAFMDSQTQIDHIFIISDDIPWCKQTFKDPRVIFIEGLPDYIDFYIQTLCTHNIISNSTFSRWGAYLNENKNKIVVAPAVWFGGPVANEITDVFLNNWNFIN
jgi:hypothetical protein